MMMEFEWKEWYNKVWFGNDNDQITAELLEKCSELQNTYSQFATLIETSGITYEIDSNYVYTPSADVRYFFKYEDRFIQIMFCWLGNDLMEWGMYLGEKRNYGIGEKMTLEKIKKKNEALASELEDLIDKEISKAKNRLTFLF